MRGLGLVTALAIAACTPTIDPGAYFCGPEGACPEGQACNGPDNTCVLANQALPFECGFDHTDVSGDDATATGQSVLLTSCVSPVFSTPGCLPVGDVADWFQFDVPATCGAVEVAARISFPVAFERLELQLSEENGVGQAREVPCTGGSVNPDDPEETRCLTATVQPGKHYAIGAVPDGTQDCDAQCKHNRYVIQIRLAAPQ
jgi:hypothetical protein